MRLMIDLQPDLELTTVEAQRVLEAWLAVPTVCTGILPLEGGLVNSVFQLDFDQPPHRAVVKLHGAGGDTFAAEARALEYLCAKTDCPVPSVHLYDGSGRLLPHAFLLIEHIEGVCLKNLALEPDQRADIEAQLGDVLGELHQHKGTSWGLFDSDEVSGSWTDLFTARLVDARTHPSVQERLTADVLARIDEAIEIAPRALRESGVPTLVHGDVWEGNMMVRLDGGRWHLAALLDPTLQFADRELELAYLEVFDNKRTAFFAAYSRHLPARPGYEQRRLFYWLHTALVHVGLFGDQFFCEFTARTADSIAQLQLE